MLTSMELAPYKYGTLPDKRYIRILHLQPGFKFHPLKISLSAVCLDELPHPYEAVSYVWGDKSDTHPIACDGKKIEITRNLKEALEQFRDEDHPRALWADAICINQDDLDERASQVLLMWDVYSRASHCLVWLGKASTDIRPATDLMTDLVYELVEKKRDALPKDGDFRHLIKHQGIIGGPLPPLESPEWQPVVNLFDRPYFSRIWVVQELNACQAVTVYCGSHRFEWANLVLTAQWIDTEYDTNRKIHIRRLAQTHGWWTAGNMSSVFKRYSKPEDVAKILQAFHMCDATDPRDKIFALLGFKVVRTALAEVKVDYTVPVEQLYAQVAKIILNKSKGLEFLSYHWHGRLAEQITWTLRGLAAFPSWVPRWNQPPDEQVLLLGPLKQYNAGGNTSRELEIEDNTLKVTGHIFDKVENASKIKWVDVSQRASPYVMLMAPMFAGPFDICDGGPADLPGPDVINDFIYAITAGLNENHHRLDDKYMKIGFNSWYNTLWSRGYNLFPLKHHMRFNKVPTPEWEEYQRAAYAATRGRAILTTNTGRLGLGPLGAEDGDIVCALRGGDVLYVLRPIEGYFVLIGEAYFFGAMDSEIVSDEKRWPKREFRIR